MPSLTSRPAVGDGQVLVTAARAGHPGGPPAGCPGDRRVLPESPGARIEAARPPGGGRGSPLDPGATSNTDLFEDGRDRQHVAGCEDVAQASFQQVVVLGVLGPLLHPARDARRVTRREVLGDVAADQGSTLDLPAQHLVHAPVVVLEPSLIGVLPRR